MTMWSRRMTVFARTRGPVALLVGAWIFGAPFDSPLSPRVARAQPASTRSELVQLLKVLDDRQNNIGDYRAEAYLEQTEKGKLTLVYEVVTFRRTAEQKFMLLFLKPKTAEGKGYLRADKNLWSYDPSVGKWERRTERERIGGTNSRRSDFDGSRLAEEYDPEESSEEKLGAYDARVLTLRVKPSVDVAFPVLKIWIDKKTNNLLKRQEFALSGRLLRTTYFPKWNSTYSESKKEMLWYPVELRIYDEIEKSSSTLVMIKNVDLSPLDTNLFTKAWLESKSR